MARTSGRLIVAVSAIAVFLGLMVTVLSLTTRGTAAEHCPKCGAAYQPGDVVKRPQETYYFCRKCTHSFSGPVSPDVSWTAAMEHWIGD